MAYTPALGLAICERVADGEPLLAICAADDMPDRITVWRWTRQSEEFRNMILSAREFGADALAEQCLVIADRAGNVRRDAVRIATRRWLASKIAPRRYGERLATEIPGPGADRQIIEIRWKDSEESVTRAEAPNTGELCAAPAAPARGHAR